MATGSPAEWWAKVRAFFGQDEAEQFEFVVGIFEGMIGELRQFPGSGGACEEGCFLFADYFFGKTKIGFPKEGFAGLLGEAQGTDADE